MSVTPHWADLRIGCDPRFGIHQLVEAINGRTSRRQDGSARGGADEPIDLPCQDHTFTIKEIAEFQRDKAGLVQTTIFRLVNDTFLAQRIAI
jgi:hypothetical protein